MARTIRLNAGKVALAFVLMLAGVLLAQGPLTPGANVRVVGNGGGGVLISDLGACGSTGPLTPFANLMVRSTVDGALVTCGGVAGNPAGADTQVQFNDGAIFGADADFAWNKTTNTLTVAAATTIGGLTVNGAAPTSIASTSSNSCGTTAPSLASDSTNSSGAFTVGATSGTDCTLTFSIAAAHKWYCVANNETTTVAIRATPIDTTTSKFLGTFTAADVVTYWCVAR